MYPVHLGSLHLIHCPNIYILCSESFLTSSMWKRFLDCTFILRLSISLLKGMMFSLLLVSFNTPVWIFVHLSISFLLSFFDTSNLLVLTLLYQVYLLSSYIHFECWTFLMSWLNHIHSRALQNMLLICVRVLVLNRRETDDCHAANELTLQSYLTLLFKSIYSFQ